MYVSVMVKLKKKYCKSRIFRMHFIFVYFVRGSFRTKIKCIPKIQSESENPQRSAAVRNFHVYERLGVPRIRKFSVYEIFWIYSIYSVVMSKYASEYDVSEDRFGSGGAASLSSWILTL